MAELIPGVKSKLCNSEERLNESHRLIENLIQLYDSKARLNGDKRQTVKCTTLPVPGHKTAELRSWKFDEFSYGKPNKPLPTNARGLFSYTDSVTGQHSIVVRGYDKFFNTDEVPATKWSQIEQLTCGPYDLTLKQNGCIIFIGALPDNTLLVTSKHSIGSRDDISESHAERGRSWLLTHLTKVGRTEQDLAELLSKHCITVVCELCDDEFEEHILGYPREKSGLYLHGLNLNTPKFSTYPINAVNQFAAYFGFLSNPFIVKPDLKSLKDLLQECAKTGTYDGTEVEGFVVRSKIGEADFFFKYKFEEPYLLFRQWRETTKALIAGREPRYGNHEAITREYVAFVKPLLQDPVLAKRFNENHGIISLRQKFLKHHGGDLSMIIASAASNTCSTSVKSQINWETDRFILVPIATIGCGKTTIALTLRTLFGIGHVQNDNILAKKSSFIFAQSIYQAFTSENTRIVYADRNNHMFHERASLIRDIRTLNKIPDPPVHFIAIYFDQPLEVRDMTLHRVLQRGDNHQSIRAATMKPDEIQDIMNGFHNRFQAMDLDKDPDASFSESIVLNPLDGSRRNIDIVLDFLLEKRIISSRPGQSEVDEAFKAAIDYKPEVYKVVTTHASEKKKVKRAQEAVRSPETAVSRSRIVSTDTPSAANFYGLAVLDPGKISREMNTLASTNPDFQMTWHRLKDSDRVQKEFHVTLIHQSGRKGSPLIWDKLCDLEHSMSNRTFNIRLDSVVFDDRVMTLTVGDHPSDVPHSNDQLHMTVGTASVDIKPVESKALLKKLSSSSNVGVAQIKLDIEVECKLKAFYR